ncbi:MULTISPECIES: phosphopentomutase [unclassified Clostridioides]|uniref:phosphopentomutase n=1 Tax=unclassified Clostridioides TaxID=2635829 RepID=UPI001D0C908D|nr:phosphopentomutase [Clostridioides sp. ES-S-0049-03]MCC0651713.1 phosphopentomutase [Clostridioides sp. ES-S-0001-03]MCC0657521.1 phosphopentomutase [Clostridioides sp. ES-S-0123-01]MCC0672927.1 phosphopentomutase [Clostridioides sp. ES-S-0145-01]MCC0676833.1 phosphopentomutase [Clostridioides sp. ES-W-0018-02]MCC0678797.1 phosphopentomutase [Clostridioides sp. ES-S-0005-03]MCC0703275.1 phosphopentomutase [Clostridioides sp. ES-S-0049-02]MCC0711784.1 phosphopentomutase [Clostridioides sp.
MSRVIWIVIDSVGIGALPDAENFGDSKDVSTLGNIFKEYPEIQIPNMRKLGIGNIDGVDFFEDEKEPIGCFGKCKEMSQGKDTTTGHWEMTGIIVDKPFKTFEHGFSKEIIEEFEKKTGRKVVGNKPASGTVIIDEYGEHQIKTGDVIVYTSADSVFQIAANEEVIPLEELYSMCKIAREIMMGDNAVARVIARPFIGKKTGEFVRTSNRRDYSLDPFEPTVLDNIKESGLEVLAVGKIEDIFNGKGITEAIHTKSNMDGVDETLKYMKQDNKGLIYSNLVDFDSKYGHRRDPEGYKKALEEFDNRLPEIMSNMREDDILIINADHGNDPTYKGTDHTREYIPVMIYGSKIKKGFNLGIKDTFADIGATVADILDVKLPKHGTSFKKDLF